MQPEVMLFYLGMMCAVAKAIQMLIEDLKNDKEE